MAEPSQVRAVVLAAGAGTRMCSAHPKVLHAVGGRPLIDWVLELARVDTDAPPVVVIGAGHDAVRERVAALAQVAVQPVPDGTGGALAAARPLLEGAEAVLVLPGDVPLLRPDTVRRLLGRSAVAAADAVLLSARPPDPTGYGRIIRAGDVFRAIVEERDLPDAGAPLPEVNTGVYVFRARPLWPALARLGTDNAQGERYLTDVLARLPSVDVVPLEDWEEMLGVNDRVQLAAVGAALRRRTLRAAMLAGVTVEDPETTYLEPQVTVGVDTVLRPGTILRGATRVGRDCVVGPYAELVDTVTGDGCHVDRAQLSGCRLEDGVRVGPFNRVRPGSELAAGSRLGAFTEVARSRVGPGSAVPHLTYLGDAVLGRDVNIGAGTITANWDGIAKHPTAIGDGARIGSHTVLVAPAQVGAGAYTGAGSVVTQPVPAGALGVARARQRNLLGWVARRRRASAGENEAVGRRPPASQGPAEESR